MTNIYFITSNHNNIKNSLEFIDSFKKNFKIKITNKFKKNSINLILEEFTKSKFREQITYIKKKYPKTIFGCFFSEYYCPEHQTFNSFNSKQKIILAKYKILFNFIYFVNSAATFLINFFFNKFVAFKASTIIKLIFKYLPIKNIVAFKASTIIKLIFKYLPIKNIHDDYYFFYRFKKFIIIEKYIDFYLCWNSEQKKVIMKNFKKRVFYFLPHVNFIKKINQVGITISGSVTNYRQGLLCDLDYKKILFNNFHQFNEIILEKFIYKKVFTQYSFNPSKNEYWNEPSLMRYVFSIKNNEIPIVINTFRDKIYKNVCLYFNFKKLKYSNFKQLHNYDKNLKKINNKIRIFNKKSKKLNSEFKKYYQNQ